jgi:hypothetical protein
VTTPCIPGKDLALEASTAILVTDHPHIASIEEDGGQQHLCESPEDGVVISTNSEIAFSILKAN